MNQSSDAALNDIRETRKKISAQYEHSAEKLVAHYIKLQEKHRTARLENEEAINEGIKNFERREGKPAREALKELTDKHNIPL